jgi:alanyl-tRNA synthetase
LVRPLDVSAVDCSIDWNRRFDHMQQHSGQHVLSAVFEELYQLRTVSFHLGAESSTIDLEGGGAGPDALREVERRANEVVFENRRVAVGFEESGRAQGLRKASEREGTLRIVSIDTLDRSACGGTHVRATGEIGAILLRKIEKVKQTLRVEFLCGGRAVARARADYFALSSAAQLFSAPLDDVPSLVAGQLEQGREADRARRKLETQLAGYQGMELYDATAAYAQGFRRATKRMERGSLDGLRTLAQSFTSRPKAVLMAVVEDPPSVLLAVSEDAGIDAGKMLKAALTEVGGRGGGTARMAQGSVPAKAALESVIAKLG